jgi:hypothetical protein
MRLNDSQGLDRTIAQMAATGLQGVSDLDNAIVSASGDEKARDELRSLRLRFLTYITDSANSTMLNDSPELFRYVCAHDRVVVVASVSVTASKGARDAALRRFSKRYPNATYFAPRRNPDYQALAADYFLSADEAQAMVHDVSVVYPGVTPWIDHSYRNCPAR